MDSETVKDLFIAFIILFAAALITVAAIFIYKLRRRRPDKNLAALEYHYNLKPLLMTKAEAYFYFRLCEIIPQGFVIIPQMPFSSVIDRPASAAANSKIDRKIIDYGIFKDVRLDSFPYRSLTPALLIELDDESHNESHRIRRDDFINAVCKQINLPILHVQKQDDYNMGALRREIMNLIK